MVMLLVASLFVNAIIFAAAGYLAYAIWVENWK